MKRIVYQALLSDPGRIALVRSRTKEVERIGGRVSLAPPTRVGMVLVVLELPEGYTPNYFFPGMPFYPL